MYAQVTEVHPTDAHELILTFDNQERRVFDISPYLDIGRFAELKDLAIFKRLAVAFDTVAWENGLDLDPEFLYAKSTRLSTS